MRVRATLLFFCAASALVGCSKLLGLDGLVADRDASVTGAGSSGQSSGAGASGSTGQTTGVTTGASTGSGCAASCGTPGCGACPSTPRISVGTYSIDAYEVTNAQYAAWLATSPSVAGQGPAPGTTRSSPAS